MKPFVQYALIGGAVIVIGGGVAMATIERSSAPAAEVESAAQADLTAHNGNKGRSAGGKFFAQFDLDHDGKVTREEFNRAIAQEFAQAAGAQQAMSEPQYIAFRTQDLRQKTDQMFHRDDWNDDGKLSLEEYATPERARFQYADRDGSGVISCGSRGRTEARASSSDIGDRSYGGGRSSGGGRAAICKADDLNHDGQVTRAEFDAATAQEFAASAKGGLLTADAFYAIVATHVRDSAAKTFARLDKDHDGKLTRDEFAASEIRYFARLDRNNDGVVTRDETYSRRYGDATSGKPGRT
jgi:Ca2+-binding EF-hand superfamily protein